MRRKTIPTYTLHKPSGQGRVRINGKDHYLGEYNSPDSLKLYDELIEQYLRDRDVGNALIAVDELALKFMAYAEKRYVKNGKQTTRVKDFRQALKYLVRHFGEVRALEFGPRRLKVVREAMKDKCVRNTVNKYVACIVTVFRWAVSEELVPETVHRAIASVIPLREGECRDNAPVGPVSIRNVVAVKKFVTDPIWGMIRLQLYTAARPGEVRIIRPCDIDMSGPVWKYTPQTHKTEHHGKRRLILIGQRGQAVIREYLTCKIDGYLFRPCDARSSKRYYDHYTEGGYSCAVLRACRRAQITRWHPHQLRHTAATFIRKEFDLDTARAILGHGAVSTTEIYAERDESVALRAMEKIG